MSTERQLDQQVHDDLCAQRLDSVDRITVPGGLLLRRRLGETVIIDGGISVTVTEIRGGRVALVFRAPENVKILREELIGRDSHVSG